MKRRLRRQTSARGALVAADIPTFSGPRVLPSRVAELRFIPSPGLLSQGQRVYAIGDVHGSLEQLRALHAAVAEDLGARPVASPVVVHLGDYIDHGPDSAGVIAFLSAGGSVPGARVVNLMGEHERMLLDALEGDRAAATDWLWSGGKTTRASGWIRICPASTGRRRCRPTLSRSCVA